MELASMENFDIGCLRYDFFTQSTKGRCCTGGESLVANRTEIPTELVHCRNREGHELFWS
jgi:hypothetical protein